MSSDRGWRWILDEAKRARVRNALLPEHAKPVVTRPAGIGSRGLTAAERECAQLRIRQETAMQLAAQLQEERDQAIKLLKSIRDSCHNEIYYEHIADEIDDSGLLGEQ